MSDTDDTDVLLLIPPNFFLVHSSASDNSLLDSSRTVVHKPNCTAQVLGKLVNRVHSLESRLNSLEFTNSTINDLSSPSTSRYLDLDKNLNLSRQFFTFPRRRRRKIKGGHNSSLMDTNSSDLNHSVINLNVRQPIECNRTEKPVESQSMDGDISSVTSTPSKKNDKLLLHEIDEFLTKVEAYETPITVLKDHESISPENLIKATGDYISHKLDEKNEIKLPSGRSVSADILDKYIYLTKNTKDATKSQGDMTIKPLSPSSFKNNEQLDPIVQPSDISKSLQEIKSPTARKLQFTDGKDLQTTSTPKQSSKVMNYLDSFRPSSNKIYDRVSKVLEQCKSQSQSCSLQDSRYISPKKEEFKMPQMRPYVENKNDFKPSAKFMDSIDTDLLSLSELWGNKEDRIDRIDSNKLEEERLKREHCEAMIQQLQKKILEQQERLAVAIKVDRTKDTAIAKLKEAWLKLTKDLDKAEERHRSVLEKMIREVDNFKMVADDAQKKTSHFEAELYKALDLAHDYQNKCKQMSSEKKELQINTNKILTEKDEVISNKTKEMEVLKDNYETVMRLNKQSTDCVKNLEDVLEKERSEHESTKNKITELNQKIQIGTEEVLFLKQERDILKEKVNEERARSNILEQQLCEKQNQTSDLLRKCDNLDNDVKTLRKHLELQKNELKTHYQKQLEDAVLAKLHEFQQQLDSAEKDMEREAKNKESALIETYNKQIVRIEEQHKLEVNLLEEKQREEIKLYRLQLAQATEKIGLLENKVESFRRGRGELASQLHGVMQAQWRQALRILTRGNVAALDASRPQTASSVMAQDMFSPKLPSLTMPFAEKCLQRAEDKHYSADKQFNMDGLSDNELQQYVRQLLNKQVNLDGSGDSAPTIHTDTIEEPTSDRVDKEKRDMRSKRSLSSNKPPWKS